MERTGSGHRNRLATPVVAGLLFLVVIAYQRLGGAYDSEFGSHPDEAAHYVTGLLVRDYVAAGFPGDPLAYAQQYYQHYPKVALGHWPPVFYIVQSVWTLVLGPGRAALLSLMALVTMLTALTVFWLLKQEFPPGLALAGAVLFLSLPLVQQAAGAVMSEMPVTLLVLAAAIAFGRYLERERTGDALRFGGVASVAILTKFSGLALAGLPPLALLLARKFYLLWRASFWWPAVLVLAFCGPWTAFTLKLASEGMSEEAWGWAFTHQAAPFYLGKFYETLGGGVILLGAIGVWTKLFCNNSEHPRAGLWPAAGGLLGGVLCLHLMVPCGLEARHLTSALPAAVLFAIAGVDWLAGGLRRRGLASGIAWGTVVAVAAAVFAGETFRIARKGYQGFGAVAGVLLRDPAAQGADFLIVSDARGEGMFISEVAMRERRPGHRIQRGSKELARSSWSGSGYQSRFGDAPSLLGFLRTNTARYLVMDTSLPAGARKDYHDLLSRVVESDPERFPLRGEFPVQRAGLWHANGIRLHQVPREPAGAAAH